MPYASNISIAVLDDNVLESQAIETLSAIGLSYEKYKTANNVYFNIIGTLSDSELNKIKLITMLTNIINNRVNNM